jgi:hypothetical protein
MTAGMRAFQWQWPRPSLVAASTCKTVDATVQQIYREARLRRGAKGHPSARRAKALGPEGPGPEGPGPEGPWSQARGLGQEPKGSRQGALSTLGAPSHKGPKPLPPQGRGAPTAGWHRQALPRDMARGSGTGVTWVQGQVHCRRGSAVGVHPHAARGAPMDLASALAHLHTTSPSSGSGFLPAGGGAAATRLVHPDGPSRGPVVGTAGRSRLACALGMPAKFRFRLKTISRGGTNLTN